MNNQRDGFKIIYDEFLHKNVHPCDACDLNNACVRFKICGKFKYHLVKVKNIDPTFYKIPISEVIKKSDELEAKRNIDRKFIRFRR